MKLEIKIELKSTLHTYSYLIYVLPPPGIKKNIFRTKITKENFLIRIRSSFLCRFIVTLFPEKKKSINQPSNDCKKEWIFLSFCQFFFFSNKKKLYWGPRMTPHKELKASIPQEAQYSSTKKKSSK